MKILIKNIKFYLPKLFVLIALLVVITVEIFAARVKDIAHVSGVSGQQVIGYGLVTGLNQTGDNQLNQYTNQSINNMLQRFGLLINNRNSRTRNVAAVMIIATVPTFSKKGSKIDIIVSSMGDATSLQGGMLVMSPISMPNGDIIGYAQGPLTVGGYDVRSLGSQVSKNFVTTGRVPNGLVLEVDFDSEIAQNNLISINLRDPDFTTVTRISAAINNLQGMANTAQPVDAGTVQVQMAANINRTQLLQNIARIEAIDINVDPIAKVVINERTGTVVVGGNVELLPAVVAHGGLDITIQKQIVVPQPAPFTILPPRIGETADIGTSEEVNPATALEVTDPTVGGIARALNLLQVKPRDLIAIFQALKDVGSLQAELVIQ